MNTLDSLESLFLALGDKTRLKLVALMAAGPVAVGVLADELGESQPKVSRHLAYLRNAGVVETRRDGKWVYYGLRQPVDPAIARILNSVVESVAVAGTSGAGTFVPPPREMTATPDIQEVDVYGYADMYPERSGVNELEIYLL